MRMRLSALAAAWFLWAAAFGQSSDTLTLVAVGDIMLGTNYPAGYLPPGNDCRPLLEEVKPYLRDADVTFGNLEGTFSDNPAPYAKSCSNPRWCYRFSMPEKYVQCLTDAGFDILNMANNHVHDLGTYGKRNTMRVLREAGLRFMGVCERPTDTFTVKGVKFGFAGFAPNSGTCSINDYRKMEETVKKLKETCDIVVVSFHGGAEGSKYQHVPKKTEYFLGQNRGNVYEFAHRAIDAGADLVIGHGPHVTRAVENYKGKLIAYSLGNFCTYKRFNIRGPNGIAPILKVYLDKEGNFLEARIIPVYQDENRGTLIDPQKRVIEKIRTLTAEDFPHTPLVITDDGRILPRKE
ncbi:MAG: CapA family protein [Chlorobi bacterium]|nr:CapA family protein [Chlorobiota bacterium]